MRRAVFAACVAVIVGLTGCERAPQYRVIQLPEGIMDIHEPLTVDADTEVRGSAGGSASPFWISSIEIRSGVRMTAM